jgi:hypothetical protein
MGFSVGVNSFVTIATECINDVVSGTYFGPNSNRANNVGVQVSEYVTDTTSPSLTNWYLDLTTSTISLEFDEPVKASTLGATQITLHNQEVYDASTQSSVTLSSGSTTSSSDGATLVLNIMNAGGLGSDFDDISYARTLAIDQASSWIAFSPDLVVDMSLQQNKVNAITSAGATQVHTYIADTASPTLMTYDVDINAATITMTFSEAVYVDIFDVTKVTLRSSAASATYTHTLSDQTTVAQVTLDAAAAKSVAAYPIVVLDVHKADLDALKTAR